MKTKIKRLAQFLFDNAEMIARELKKSSHYRSISITLDVHKHEDESPKLQANLSFYDEKTTHYFLYNNAICIERFKQICEQMNSESGLIALPKPVKVRKKLNIKELSYGKEKEGQEES